MDLQRTVASLSWAVALVALLLATSTYLAAPDDGLAVMAAALGSQFLLSVGLIVALLFIRRRVAEIVPVADVVSGISAGDLDAPVAPPSRWREIASLGDAVETLRTVARGQASSLAEAHRQLAIAQEAEARIDAVSKHQAVIEFDASGAVLRANDNFCRVMGYDAQSLVGIRHASFMDADEARSEDYAEFWRKLRSGRMMGGEVKRLTRSGEVVWLSATYNPIVDGSGEVVKVIKFATDVTARKRAFEDVVGAVVLLSEGDLGARIPEKVADEFATLRDAFNAMVERLQAMIGDIRAMSAAMASDVGRIAAGSKELSSRTDSQAASVQQTSAAIEEIAATIRQNAGNAASAEAVAFEMSDRAKTGVTAVAEAVDAMGRIERSSGQISEIVSVIDSIAFQTNLLALNAAVEAARAGDAGKGFAVVAAEVRTLAQRASTAAKDISDLINDSTRQIASGSKLVRRSGETFAEINAKIGGVASSVSEISAASREQALGVTEISSAIAQIDGATQESARLSDDSARMTGEIVEKTETLSRMVAFFRSAEKAWSSSAPAAAPRAKATSVVSLRRAGSGAAAMDDWRDF